MFERRERIAELLKQEVSSLIRTLKDPRLAGLITITDLDLSKDMKTARIYYSVLGSDEDRKATVKILDQAAGYFYHQLKSRLSMRLIPFLEFRYDDTPVRAHRIEEILDQIHKEDAPEPPQP